MPLQAWNLGQSEYVRQAQQGIPSQNLTATGNSQGTAFQTQTDFCIFSTVAASTGCLLLGAADTASTPGPCLLSDTQIIVNHGANALTVYPQVGGKISTLALNAGFNVPVGKSATFQYLGSGGWSASVSA